MEAMKYQKTVLVVDDDENILNLLEICLSDNFIIKKAKNGKEALKILNEKTPDLVLLDLMMPNISGKDVCRELRKKSDVPIIFLSAKDQRDEFLRDPLLRITEYIPKPFDPQDLVQRISGYLN